MKSEADDPTHPNWDGITFRPTTDHMGVVVIPTSAQSMPPYTYLPIPDAIQALGDLRAVIYGLEAKDRKSYFAHFLETVASDLSDAILQCRPDPTPKIETPANATSPDVPGPAA